VGLVITSQKESPLEEDLKIKFNDAFLLICNEEQIKQCSINVRIMNDKEMQELNKKFRGKDASTNVLSFTNEDISKTITGNLGDIAINYDYLERESTEQSKSFDDHMIHMLVHGIYHILGFDHKNDEIAKVMERKEITLLNKFKIDNPYN
jgi:probable rRNA maturation factor